jgi:RimK-like ATP-grasp domain
MILVCGGLADPVTELVCARIEQLNYPYRLLNLGLFPHGHTLDCRWQAGEITGRITGPDWDIDLSRISGVFVRYVEGAAHAPMSAVRPELESAALAECQAGVTSFLEHFPRAVANRCNPSLSNQSKPYQSCLIRAAGFSIPETFITSDPDAARAFIAEYDGDVIFKSLSAVRSIVRRPSTRDIERLPLLRECPVQFQRYVPGDNIRVHVVGDEVFATRARSEAVDYRYAKQQGCALEMEPADLPAHVQASCISLSRTLGLLLTGIDLKETPDGEYFCFEVNTSPGFIFYESHTGQPISTALVELLRRGEPASCSQQVSNTTAGRRQHG